MNTFVGVQPCRLPIESRVYMADGLPILIEFDSASPAAEVRRQTVSYLIQTEVQLLLRKPLTSVAIETRSVGTPANFFLISSRELLQSLN